MRVDTAGNQIFENIPVYGCPSRNTTAGRLGCWKHSNMDFFPLPIPTSNDIVELFRMFGRDVNSLKRIEEVGK